jgi:hypothetical protein
LVENNTSWLVWPLRYLEDGLERAGEVQLLTLANQAEEGPVPAYSRGLPHAESTGWRYCANQVFLRNVQAQRALFTSDVGKSLYHWVRHYDIGANCGLAIIADNGTYTQLSAELVRYSPLEQIENIILIGIAHYLQVECGSL